MSRKFSVLDSVTVIIAGTNIVCVAIGIAAGVVKRSQAETTAAGGEPHRESFHDNAVAAKVQHKDFQRCFVSYCWRIYTQQVKSPL